MYSELAEWWPLVSPPEDYVQESGVYRETLLTATDTPPASVLELGSGGGNNASFLKETFQMTLVDLSPDMLAVSRRLNPELEHIEGDLRTVRLGREFDAVFVHDAIAYMTTLEDLEAAMTTAFVHCRAGGAALFVPDVIRETFRPSTHHEGQDGSDRALRYMEWNWDPDENDSTFVTDYVYALREGDELRVLHDRHILGRFSEQQWLDGLGRAGFTGRSLQLEVEDLEAPSFLGLK